MKSKKIISVILTLLMVFSIINMNKKSVNAATTISTIILDNVTSAHEGNNPYFGVTVPDTEHYKIKISSIDWFDRTNWKHLNSSDKFEKGVLYELSVVVQADDGYVFDDESKIKIIAETTAPVSIQVNKCGGTGDYYPDRIVKLYYYIPKDDECTVIYDSNGGTGYMPFDLKYKGGTLKLPNNAFNPPSDDYYFVRWNYGNEGDILNIGSSWNFVRIVAQWGLKPKTVSFDPNGGTVDLTSATTGTDGKLTTLPTPQKTLYSFDGWYTKKSGGDKITENTVFTSDTTVYAHWIRAYSVTVTRGTADKTTACAGETVTVTADAPGEGRAFSYWTITGGGVMMNTSYTSTTSFTMPDGDVTATPSYKWVGGYIKEFKAYVTPPVAGEHPRDATVKTDEYTVRKTIWAGEEEGRKLTSNDTFIEGNHYACYVYLTNLAKPYDGDMIGYINDSSENVSIVNSNYQGKMGVRIGSDIFTATKANSGNSGNGNGSGNGNSGNGNNNGSTETPKNKLVTTDGKSQYYKEDGTVAKNEWVTINNIKYYFNADGYNASNEWINGKWISADGSCTYEGELKWKSNSTGWWVEDTKGWYPVSSWQKIDGVWYYFNASGYMASNEYYNGYWFNSDGSWDPQYFLTWKSNSTGWWVEDKSGWYPSSQWVKIDGYWYYFDGSGYMVTSQYVDGYWLGADGACQ